jgi:hypothetical protein
LEYAQNQVPQVGGGKAALFILLNSVHIFFWSHQLLTHFSPLLRSRGGILFEQEGEEVDQDLEGIDFDNLEALANEGTL